MNAIQINSQLQPAPRRRAGVGAVTSQEIRVSSAFTSYSTKPADATSMLSVYLPSGGQPVTSSWTGGISSAIGGTCPNPCWYNLDGSKGVLTLSWPDPITGASQTVTITITGGAGGAPPKSGHVVIVPVKQPPKKPAPGPGPTGGVQGPTPSPAPASTSSKTVYIVGGLALAAAAGGAYWKWGMKHR